MKHTAATREKLSEMRRGERNPFYGRTHTPEVRARLSAAATVRNRSRTYEAAPQRIVVPEDPVTLAYIAGIVDGEGSIRFRRDHSTSKLVERPFVSVTNTHEALIAWFSATLQWGSVSKGNTGRKVVLVWAIQGARDVHALLVALHPYLIVKREDADAVLHFLHAKYGWDRTCG